MHLEGRTVLITGAATGIGKAIALKFASHGANIVINYSKSEAEAEDTLREVEQQGVKGLVCRADVSIDEQVRGMVEQAVQAFGRIDVLINNAGTTQFVALSDLDGMTEEIWDRVFDVNVKGVFFTSRACAPELVRNRGCIINITSIAGFSGHGSSLAYAASKAAAISITRSFARVLAPHVRVNSIAPGVVVTRWVDGHDDHIQNFAKATPFGRAATPEDVADAAWGLVCGGQFITGQTLVVDGGWSLNSIV
ncbi:3-oxoacyl-[acyl-carrier-protein] reductase fabG [Thermobacillus xylanilyticus]|jgi:3-oxoacyl-[acyl-carrier protein] reductase|uniref:3-oxoacyl-[acyl-carrier-protein] reductase fabG n=1 Tax=Thermobacillus xylanilyticus TaxID=76633 RepID=A0ABN7RR46_THEXY|nr:glucose 1-dehydrogenase [Thermobacillus xylanilyticus]CAG5080042.1 3-oxoacyl-[acyl-carrier-protein] reductase fabG [Thermobacillus xylanilyticus]